MTPETITLLWQLAAVIGPLILTALHNRGYRTPILDRLMDLLLPNSPKPKAADPLANHPLLSKLAKLAERLEAREVEPPLTRFTESRGIESQEITPGVYAQTPVQK